MTFCGTIIRLTRYAGKGVPGETLQCARLRAGLGMEGDCHAQGGERQISLLPLEARQWMDARAEPGLCFRRYKENILFDGPASLAPGTRLRAGEAALEISARGKECFEECPLFRKERRCVLAGRNLFARVIRGGVARPGDRLETEGPEGYCKNGEPGKE
jgi:MOSC domain-containing protein YiiM